MMVPAQPGFVGTDFRYKLLNVKLCAHVEERRPVPPLRAGARRARVNDVEKGGKR